MPRSGVMSRSAKPALKTGRGGASAGAADTFATAKRMPVNRDRRRTLGSLDFTVKTITGWAGGKPADCLTQLERLVRNRLTAGARLLSRSKLRTSLRLRSPRSVE